jgi:hypothetical protein
VAIGPGGLDAVAAGNRPAKSFRLGQRDRGFNRPVTGISTGFDDKENNWAGLRSAAPGLTPNPGAAFKPAPPIAQVPGNPFRPFHAVPG